MSTPPVSTHTLSELTDHRRMTLDLLARARRQVDLCARHLDPRLYDDPEVLAGLQALVLGSPRARVRILILKAEGLEKRGHRLIELAGRLSSFMDLRVPSPEDGEFNSAMLLVDDSGYVWRPQSDRYEGSADSNDRARVAQLRREFDLLWERALPASEFRRLGI